MVQCSVVQRSVVKLVMLHYKGNEWGEWVCNSGNPHLVEVPYNPERVSLKGREEWEYNHFLLEHCGGRCGVLHGWGGVHGMTSTVLCHILGLAHALHFLLILTADSVCW